LNLRGAGWEGVDWIHLVRGKDQWQALMSKIMNLQVPKKKNEKEKEKKLLYYLSDYQLLKNNSAPGSYSSLAGQQ
jgi:hypothetical protein